MSFHALRQIPKLDNVLKETLRLHPPLIILMRVAKGEFEVEGFPIHEGDFVAASPAISNRIPEDFPDPDAFIPDRYNKPEPGRHDQPVDLDPVRRRAGTAASAPRSPPCRSRRSSRSCCASTSSRWRSRPTATSNDHSKMVVQLAQPAKVRYRKRKD